MLQVDSRILQRRSCSMLKHAPGCLLSCALDFGSGTLSTIHELSVGARIMIRMFNMQGSLS